MESQWPHLHKTRGSLKFCFMHKAVNSTAPSYVVEILSNAVHIDKHYKLRNDDDVDQLQLELKKLRNHYFQIVYGNGI